MESCPVCVTTENKQNRDKLSRTQQEVEKITDKLGKGIEQGIRETVSVLRAMGLETDSSCAGHKEDGEKLGLPYVQVYAPAPDGWKNDWQNKKLQELWR